MAETETKKLIIDASQAQNAIRGLITRTNDYNQSVREVIRTMKDHNQASQQAITITNNYVQVVYNATTAMGSKNKILKEQKDAVLADADATKRAAAELLGYSGKAKSATDVMNKKNRVLKEQKKATDEDAKATKELGTNLFNVINATYLLHRALATLVAGMVESTSEANEFLRRIAEIKTVSIESSDGILKSAKSTGTWSNELLSLSRAFGVDKLEAARAEYEALSNQVVTAGNSTNFMASEMKLALTTVSTLDKAVEVTSTVINAYHKSSSEAERINAVLFRGVDLGRFKLEELGSSFGRVSLLANQLGVSFEEVVGSLALLTRLGVQADVANTLLANTFNALVKPSKEMTAFLRSYGFASGEAAIATKGWAGIFQILAKEIENGNGLLTELSGKFEDIRGLTGAAGLTGNFKQLASVIRDVSDAQAMYNKAFDLTIENLGVRGKVELEKFKQFFLVQFGFPIQRTLVKTAEFFGGADKAMSALTGTVVVLTTATAAYGVALGAVNASIHIRTAGVSLLIGLLAEEIRREVSAKETLQLYLAQFRSDRIEETRKSLEKFSTALGLQTKAFEENIEVVKREYGEFFASIRKINFALEDSFEKTYKGIVKAVKEAFADAITSGTKSLHAFEASIKKSESAIERMKKGIEDAAISLAKLKGERDERSFREGLSAMKPEDAAVALAKEAARVEKEALAALGAGKRGLADDLFKRFDELNAEAINKLKKLKTDADAIITTSTTTVTGRGVRTRTPTGSITVPFAGVRGGSGTSSRFGSRSFAGAPRSSFSATARTTAARDAEESTRLATLILGLEKDRTASAKDRIKAEEALLAKTEAALKAEEALLAKKKVEADRRAKHLELFKEHVNKIDSFDKNGDPAELGELIKGAKFEGREAGIDFLVLRTALEKANDLKLALEKKGAAERAKVNLDALEKQSQDSLNSQKAAFDKLQKLRTDQASEAKRIANEGQTNVKEALGILGNINTSPGKNVKENETEAGRAKIALREAFEASGKLFDRLSDSAKNGKPSADILKQIAEQQERLNKALIEFEKHKDSLGTVGILGGLRGLIGGGKPAFTQGGQLAGAGLEGGDKQDSLHSRLDKTKADLLAFAKLQQDLANAAKQAEVERLKAETARMILLEQRTELERLAGAASVSSGQATLNIYFKINQQLEAMLQNLIKINNINRPPGGQDRGNGPGNAFGFVGTDQRMANVADGESIMSRLATRQYAPFLRSIQHQSPSLRSDNTVMNFGDITFNMPQGSAQPANIANQLVRLKRRGFRT